MQPNQNPASCPEHRASPQGDKTPGLTRASLQARETTCTPSRSCCSPAPHGSAPLWKVSLVVRTFLLIVPFAGDPHLPPHDASEWACLSRPALARFLSRSWISGRKADLSPLNFRSFLVSWIAVTYGKGHFRCKSASVTLFSKGRFPYPGPFPAPGATPLSAPEPQVSSPWDGNVGESEIWCFQGQDLYVHSLALQVGAVFGGVFLE